MLFQPMLQLVIVAITNEKYLLLKYLVKFVQIYSFFLCYLPSNIGLTPHPPGLRTQMPMGQMPVGGATGCRTEH